MRRVNFKRKGVKSLSITIIWTTSLNLELKKKNLTYFLKLVTLLIFKYGERDHFRF